MTHLLSRSYQISFGHILSQVGIFSFSVASFIFISISQNFFRLFRYMNAPIGYSNALAFSVH